MEIILSERLNLFNYNVDVYVGRDENMKTMVRLVLRKARFAAEYRFDLEFEELEQIWNTCVRLVEILNKVEDVLLGGDKFA